VNKLKFESFDTGNLLGSSGSQLLMASEGKVFDRETKEMDSAGSDPLKQRSLFNKRLGLDIAEKIGIDTSDIVSTEDFMHVTPTTSHDLNRSTSFPGSGSDSDLLEPNLSSREINLARRRARKQKSREASENAEQQQASSKKLKREDSICTEMTFRTETEDGLNFYEKAREEGRWPLEDWVQLLVQDLFSPAWELRHGSGTALRVIVRLHGQGAGKRSGASQTEVRELLHPSQVILTV